MNRTSIRTGIMVIGAIMFILGFVSIITGIVAVASGAPISQLGFSREMLLDLKASGMTDSDIRTAYAGVVCLSGVWLALQGWLMRRAAKNPEKSKLLLGLLTYSLVSCFTSLFSSIASPSPNPGIVTTVIETVVYVASIVMVSQLRKDA